MSKFNQPEKKPLSFRAAYYFAHALMILLICVMVILAWSVLVATTVFVLRMLGVDL